MPQKIRGVAFLRERETASRKAKPLGEWSFYWKLIFWGIALFSPEELLFFWGIAFFLRNCFFSEELLFFPPGGIALSLSLSLSLSLAHCICHSLFWNMVYVSSLSVWFLMFSWGIAFLKVFLRPFSLLPSVFIIVFIESWSLFRRCLCWEIVFVGRWVRDSGRCLCRQMETCVLQCVAVCCSVLQCVVESLSALRNCLCGQMS